MRLSGPESIQVSVLGTLGRLGPRAPLEHLVVDSNNWGRIDLIPRISGRPCSYRQQLHALLVSPCSSLVACFSDSVGASMDKPIQPVRRGQGPAAAWLAEASADACGAEAIQGPKKFEAGLTGKLSVTLQAPVQALATWAGDPPPGPRPSRSPLPCLRPAAFHEPQQQALLGVGICHHALRGSSKLLAASEGVGLNLEDGIQILPWSRVSSLGAQGHRGRSPSAKQRHSVHATISCEHTSLKLVPTSLNTGKPRYAVRSVE